MNSYHRIIACILMANILFAIALFVDLHYPGGAGPSIRHYAFRAVSVALADLIDQFGESLKRKE